MFGNNPGYWPAHINGADSGIFSETANDYYESGKIKFHCTIVSRRISDKFSEIWEYVNKLDCNFDTYLDNITIMKWGENRRWNVYKQYLLK